jgi:branched-chain amino acid transport system permease protein
MLFEVFVNGLVLGGMYGLVALGLNLQYGVARMMNLSYGEFFMGGAFSAYLALTLFQYSPLLGGLASIPIAFAVNWVVYRYLLQPLISRAPNQDALDADVILFTFGLLFVFQGLALVNWGGEYRSYSFLAVSIDVFGAQVALNRLIAFFAACLLAVVLFAVLRKTRTGTALRGIAIDPIASRLVGVDVRTLSALAFATGGALAATSGVLVSMFMSFNASVGVVYTMKALIVVIMGGVGRMMGGLAAGLLLGVFEAVGGYLVDPGLTLAINFALFILVLLLRPKGLFSRG